MSTQYDDAYIETLQALSDRDKLALILGQSLHIGRLKTALGCPDALIDEAVACAELLASAEQRERVRIATALRKWADDMDAPEWRDGWTREIVAAKSFATQIESGTL